ncbi:forkhead box protein N3 [Zootermopsis nevadensis]|uniref:Forkhead box protein N3 n=1 Tax=Zootermopsis nevadensis TaxID=136037 RepID=A0A067RH70_ZOONE|nr:forkhead box protein N3 [Zootermopsis nevadensis]XP_021913706.1 forkhead box protein N3 [Zootermopsis nevadensis]XP_021913707.1 forkhead box protein N3 [Zootermopsis nevadensis]XP_021913708.1 forkhead box protein N3 [Zootermopsis nevadensis]XP_021913709.1 forkhead box protein N3 [Zootermopsis nevadensis]XP_021913710.1 forkhead box protein N3 [Zootermopsis nevadensis]XP_021913712.1 forkhead box protein N3 [Zootermopsis nevadensis]XP_021913713.1 forkhead box protein N3 [Zootermopsis nevaden
MMAPERPGPEDKPGVALVQSGGAVTIPVIPVFSLPNTLMQLKEGDGASNVPTVMEGENPERLRVEDDDLTSLTWLQDKNLLKGMNLRAAVGEHQLSPTSDFVDDSASELADSTCSSGHSPSPAPPSVATSSPNKQKHPQHMPYDPLVHVNSKPPYSFSCLIFMAIEDSPQRALPVKEIYAWILEHFPYFKNAPTGWKNSVRHNLSLNKCFRKVEKAPNLGKGSLWMVDPLYRPNLMQALQKAPFHPYTTLDRVSMVTNRVQVNSPLGAVGHSEFVVIKSSSRLPNPDLFPYLSRRLAASGVEGLRSRDVAADSDTTTTDDADSLDDVDAAAAMLALKHGPRMLTPKKVDWDERPQGNDGVGQACLLDIRNPRKKTRASKNTQDTGRKEKMIPVITTSPSEDHTYSAGPTIAAAQGIAHPALPSSSPEEAFEEGSESDDSFQAMYHYKSMEDMEDTHAKQISSLPPSDSEEQRKIAEGADALLNLAGISTRKRTQCVALHPPVPGKRMTTRGRRKTPYRPRLLRSIRPNIKKKPEVIHQQNQKPQTLINNNSSSNNNNIVMTPGNNVKLLRTSPRSSLFGNTNEYEFNHNTAVEKTKR